MIAFKAEETNGQHKEAPARKLKPSRVGPACGSALKKAALATLASVCYGCAMQHDHATKLRIGGV